MVITAGCGGGGDATGATTPAEAVPAAQPDPPPTLPDGPIGSRLATTSEGCVAAGAVLDLAFQNLALGVRGADPTLMADVAAQADAFRPSMPEILREAVGDAEAAIEESAAVLAEQARRDREIGRTPDVLAQQAIVEQLETEMDALVLNDLLVVRCGFG